MSLRVRVRNILHRIIILILVLFPLLLVMEFHKTINTNYMKANSFNYKISENSTFSSDSLRSSPQMDILWNDIEQNINEENLNGIITDTNGSSIGVLGFGEYRSESY